MGKSSIAKEIAHYFHIRNLFPDGIYYIPLMGCSSIQHFKNRMITTILKN
jgi:hypothetical protein